MVLLKTLSLGISNLLLGRGKEAVRVYPTNRESYEPPESKIEMNIINYSIRGQKLIKRLERKDLKGLACTGHLRQPVELAYPRS